LISRHSAPSASPAGLRSRFFAPRLVSPVAVVAVVTVASSSSSFVRAALVTMRARLLTPRARARRPARTVVDRTAAAIAVAVVVVDRTVAVAIARGARRPTVARARTTPILASRRHGDVVAPADGRARSIGAHTRRPLARARWGGE